MNRLGEAVRDFLMRERLVQRFGKEVEEGGIFTFDVFLKQGTEYAVRGKVSTGEALAGVSLAEPCGTMTPIHNGNGATYFSVVPEKDGLYQIRAVVEPAAEGGAPVTVTVSVYHVLPLPAYATDFEAARIAPRPKSRQTEQADAIEAHARVA